MFEVVRTIGQGWWRDRVILRALSDVDEERLRLEWDFMGNPGATRQYMRLARGAEFEVWLPHALAEQAGTLTLEQVANLRGFRHLWREVAEKGQHVL